MLPPRRERMRLTLGKRVDMAMIMNGIDSLLSKKVRSHEHREVWLSYAAVCYYYYSAAAPSSLLMIIVDALV